MLRGYRKKLKSDPKTSTGSLKFKISLFKGEFEQGEQASSRKRKLQISGTSDKLLRVLTEVHNQLIKRDPKGIFAKPVSEDVAPEYFSVITSPMDFGTISSKLTSQNNYLTVADYLCDLRLMCSNAMLYNSPDTSYYQKARKMLAFAEKQLSPAVLRKICSDIGIRGGLSSAEIGDLEQRATECIPNIHWPVVSTRTQICADPIASPHPFTPTTGVKETSRHKSRKRRTLSSHTDDSRSLESVSIISLLPSERSNKFVSDSSPLRISCDTNQSPQNTISFENSSDIGKTDTSFAIESPVKFTQIDYSLSEPYNRSPNPSTADHSLSPIATPPLSSFSDRSSIPSLTKSSSGPTINETSLPPERSTDANFINSQSSSQEFLLTHPALSNLDKSGVEPLNSATSLSLTSMDSPNPKNSSNPPVVRSTSSPTHDQHSHHLNVGDRKKKLSKLSPCLKNLMKCSKRVRKVERLQTSVEEINIIEPKSQYPQKKKRGFRNSTPVAVKGPRYKALSSKNRPSTVPTSQGFLNHNSSSTLSSNTLSTSVNPSTRLYAEDFWSFSDSMTDLTPADQVLVQIKDAAKRAQEKLLTRLSSTKVVDNCVECSKMDMNSSPNRALSRQTIVYLDTSQPGQVRAIPCPLANTRICSTPCINNQTQESEHGPSIVNYPNPLIRLLTGSSISSTLDSDGVDAHNIEAEENETQIRYTLSQASHQLKSSSSGLIEQMTTQQVSSLHSLSKLRFASDEPISANIHGPLAIFNTNQLAELLDLYGGDQTTVEYALSLLNFVEPIGDWARSWASKKLDLATAGLHSMMLSSISDSRLSIHCDSEKSGSDWMKTAGLTIDPDVYPSHIFRQSSSELPVKFSTYDGTMPIPSPNLQKSEHDSMKPETTDINNPISTTISVESVRQTATVQPLQRTNLLPTPKSEMDSFYLTTQSSKYLAIGMQNGNNIHPVTANMCMDAPSFLSLGVESPSSNLFSTPYFNVGLQSGRPLSNSSQISNSRPRDNFFSSNFASSSVNECVFPSIVNSVHHDMNTRPLNLNSVCPILSINTRRPLSCSPLHSVLPISNPNDVGPSTI